MENLELDLSLLAPVETNADADRVLLYLASRGAEGRDIVDDFGQFPPLAAFYNYLKTPEAVYNHIADLIQRMALPSFFKAASDDDYLSFFNYLTDSAFGGGETIFKSGDTLRATIDQWAFGKKYWRNGAVYWYEVAQYWMESIDAQGGIMLSDAQISELDSVVTAYVHSCWDAGVEAFATESEYERIVLRPYKMFLPGQIQAVTEQAIDRETNRYVVDFIEFYTAYGDRQKDALKKIYPRAGRWGKFSNLTINKVVREIAGRAWWAIPINGKFEITAGAEDVFSYYDRLPFTPAAMAAHYEKQNYTDDFLKKQTDAFWKMATAIFPGYFGNFRTSAATIARGFEGLQFNKGLPYYGETGVSDRPYLVSLAQSPEVWNAAPAYGPPPFKSGAVYSYGATLPNASRPLTNFTPPMSATMADTFDLSLGWQLRQLTTDGPETFCLKNCVAEHFDVKINNRASSNYEKTYGNPAWSTYKQLNCDIWGVSFSSDRNYRPKWNDTLLTATAITIRAGGKPNFESRAYGNYPHKYRDIMLTAFYTMRYPQLQVVETPAISKNVEINTSQFWREFYIDEDNLFLYMDTIIARGEKYAFTPIRMVDFQDEAPADEIEITYKTYGDGVGLGFVKKLWKEIKRFGRRLAAEFKRTLKKIQETLDKYLGKVLSAIFQVIMGVVIIAALVVVALVVAVNAAMALMLVINLVLGAMMWAIYYGYVFIAANMVAIAKWFGTVLAGVIGAHLGSYLYSKWGPSQPDVELPEPLPMPDFTPSDGGAGKGMWLMLLTAAGAATYVIAQ